jgi:hypothetical protein
MGPQTMARYAHLDADPLRKAADIIGQTLVSAMGGVGAVPPDDPVPRTCVVAALAPGRSGGRQVADDAATPTLKEVDLAQIDAVVAVRLEGQYVHLDSRQSFIVGACLFPTLRQSIANGTSDGLGDVVLDPALSRHYGVRAPSYDEWVKCAELMALDSQQSKGARTK